VKDGGLERFAKTHNVKPDFIYHYCDTEFAVIWAFHKELATVPGLEAIMASRSRANLPYMPFSYGIQIMQDTENGWSSEDDTEDEEDGKQANSVDKPKVGDEEASVAANASHQNKDVSRKTKL
jgi:hypothetical protein